MSASITPTDSRRNSAVVSVNPATLAVNGEVPADTVESVRAKIRLAREAQPGWAATPFKERARRILRARDWLLDHREEVALAIVRDMGKDLVGALAADVLPPVGLFTHFAEKAEGLLRPRRIPLGIYNLMLRSSYIHYVPVGVVGIISPWNFPFSIPSDEAAMALLCGNAVILKPPSSTPFVGQKIAEMFAAAGLPPGVFQLVQAPGAIASEIVKGGVDKIAFTGGVPTGKRIMADAAESLTPLVLELGGKGPMIVCEDAHLDFASSGAVWGAFFNNGQVCASIERCYVHENAAPEFVRLVVEKTRRLRQGVGESVDVDLGSMANLSQLESVERLVADARSRGGQVATGGRRIPGQKGYFYEPTVIVGVDHSFEVMREEAFGPVLPIMTFKTQDEAIRLANDSRLALTATVWTRDVERGRRIAERIEAGTVMVNECLYTHAIPATPWGGWKDSGFGRSHGELGLKEFVHAHHVHVNHLGGFKDFWWFPNGADKKEALTAFAEAQFARGLARRLRAWLRLARALWRMGRRPAW